MPLQLEPLKTRACKMARIIADADPADAKTIEAWLADPDIDSERLARSLMASGFKTTGRTVLTHRSGRCGCGAN